MDFVKQLVETTLRGEPLPDLFHQLFGDVDGAGTALVLEGGLVSSVFGTAVMTAAGGGAAGTKDLAEGAGEERAGSCGLVQIQVTNRLQVRLYQNCLFPPDRAR
jgi:hypothetical protein